MYIHSKSETLRRIILVYHYIVNQLLQRHLHRAQSTDREQKEVHKHNQLRHLPSNDRQKAIKETHTFPQQLWMKLWITL